MNEVLVGDPDRTGYEAIQRDGRQWSIRMRKNSYYPVCERIWLHEDACGKNRGRSQKTAAISTSGLMTWLRQTQRSERRTFCLRTEYCLELLRLSEKRSSRYGILLAMFPATHGGKYAGAFGSYGWSGEGVPEYYAASGNN